MKTQQLSQKSRGSRRLRQCFKYLKIRKLKKHLGTGVKKKRKIIGGEALYAYENKLDIF
jgi:hypothetical protein